MLFPFTTVLEWRCIKVRDFLEMVSVHSLPPIQQLTYIMRAFIVLAVAFVAAVSAQGGYGGHGLGSHGGGLELGGLGGGHGGLGGLGGLGGGHGGLGGLGGLGGGGGGEGGHGHEEHYVDYHAHPQYHFDYAVHDLKHHDIKHQWETRDGDKVKGEYSLVEPDGTKRIVKYEADKHTGFNAIVERVGHAIHPIEIEHGHH